MMKKINRLHYLSKEELEKKNLILSIKSHKRQTIISFLTLTVSLSSLAVSYSSVKISKNSYQMSKMSYEASLNEQLRLEEIKSEQDPTYISISKNDNNEYIISNEFNIKIINNSLSPVLLQRVGCTLSDKFNTIIKSTSGEQLCNGYGEGHLKNYIMIDGTQSANLKMVINYTITSKYIQNLISQNNLLDKKINKNEENYSDIENRIINDIYNEQLLLFICVDTSKSEGLVVGAVDIY